MLIVQKEVSFGIHNPIPPAQTANPMITGEFPEAVINGATTAAEVTRDTVVEPRPIRKIWVNKLVRSKEKENTRQGVLRSLLEIGRSDGEKEDILKYSQIDPRSFFQYITVSITTEKEESDSQIMHLIEQKIALIFEEEGKQNIYNKNKEFIDYLLYAESEEEITTMANEIKQTALNMYTRNNKVGISFSKVRKEIYEIKKMYDEAHFTNKLMKKGLIDPQNVEF